MREILVFGIAVVLPVLLVCAVICLSLFARAPKPNGDLGPQGPRLLLLRFIVGSLVVFMAFGAIHLVNGLAKGFISLAALIVFLFFGFLLFKVFSTVYRPLVAMRSPWSSRAATEEEALLFAPTSATLAQHGFSLNSLAWVRKGEDAQERLTAVYANLAGVFAVQSAMKEKVMPLSFTSFFNFEDNKPQLALATYGDAAEPLTDRLILHATHGTVEQMIQQHDENLQVVAFAGQALVVDKPYWYLEEAFTKLELEDVNDRRAALRALFFSRSNLVPVADRDLSFPSRQPQFA